MIKISQTKFILSAVLGCAVGFFGCSSNSNVNTANQTKTNEPLKTETKTVETTTTTEVTGVAECDEYIKKYEACVMNKVPEAQRTAMKSALDQSRQAWKQSASTEQGKKMLPSICKQAMDTAKQSTSAYGCAW
jgi:hypothetical protein